MRDRLTHGIVRIIAIIEMVKSGQFQSQSPAFRWDLEILASDWLEQCEVPSQICTSFWHPLVQISPIVPQTLIKKNKKKWSSLNLFLSDMNYLTIKAKLSIKIN